MIRTSAQFGKTAELEHFFVKTLVEAFEILRANLKICVIKKRLRLFGFGKIC